MALHRYLLSLLFIACATHLSVALPNVRRQTEIDIDVPAAPPCNVHSDVIGNDTDLDTVLHEMTMQVSNRETTCTDMKTLYGTSGVYLISPTGGCEFTVFCDMCVGEGEGWIVVQRRVDASVAFHHMLWEDYKYGFGDYRYNYWIGLEKLHEITSSGNYELMVGIHDEYDNSFVRAFYNQFEVGDESDFYRLTVEEYDASRSSYSHLSFESLLEHNGKKFSTPDSDNDDFDNIDCAKEQGHQHGGWWFGINQNDCRDSNLNGEYWQGSNSAMTITYWQGTSGILNRTIMAIRKRGD